MGKFGSFWNKNYPGFCIGLGIGQLLFATFYGMHSVIDAREAIDEKKEKLGTDELSTKETIKIVAPYFAPVLVLSATGVGFILFGNQVNLDRGAAAAMMYTVAVSDHKNYVEKVKEIVGEKKEQDIREAVDKDRINKNPLGNNTVIITGNGDCLCFDNVTNQYFRSNKVKIESAINNINYNMRYSNVITLNEYCHGLKLDEVELGQELGWDINENGYVDVSFTAVLTDDGEPCLVIHHNTLPKSISI